VGNRAGSSPVTRTIKCPVFMRLIESTAGF
jgi:hypothetical protein